MRIEPFPERPYLNATRGGLELHNDFIVTNDSARPLTVTRVEMSVFGGDGRLAQRRFVSVANGGPNSGLLTIPRREIGPGEKLTLFNPFYLLDGTSTSWPPGLPMNTARPTQGFGRPSFRSRRRSSTTG